MNLFDAFVIDGVWRTPSIDTKRPFAASRLRLATRSRPSPLSDCLIPCGPVYVGAMWIILTAPR